MKQMVVLFDMDDCTFGTGSKTTPINYMPYFL